MQTGTSSRRATASGPTPTAWDLGRRNRELLLPSGKRLAEGKELLLSRREEVDDDVLEYIEASLPAHRQKEEKDRHAALALIEAAEEAKRERLEREAERAGEHPASVRAERQAVGPGVHSGRQCAICGNPDRNNMLACRREAAAVRTGAGPCIFVAAYAGPFIEAANMQLAAVQIDIQQAPASSQAIGWDS